MAEVNVPACPLHGSLPRALHSENFEGIVTVIDELLATVSGVVGTTTYTRYPYGYPYNFEGVVRALEDLNASMSGIQGGGGGGGGSASGIVAGSGIYITQSGDFQVINNSLASVSGVTYTAGSGLYLSDGGFTFNADYQAIFQNVVSGHFVGTGSTTVTYSGELVTVNSSTAGGGTSVVVSGEPGIDYSAGALWFDTNEGRLFIYASGNGIQDPAWYQTNAEAIALKSEVPPSGNGENAPPRDGSIWFNTLIGSLFIYDAVTSGWYESSPSRAVAFGTASPSPVSPGAGWLDSTSNSLKIWNGTAWVSV